MDRYVLASTKHYIAVLIVDHMAVLVLYCEIMHHMSATVYQIVESMVI